MNNFIPIILIVPFGIALAFLFSIRKLGGVATSIAREAMEKRLNKTMDNHDESYVVTDFNSPEQKQFINDYALPFTADCFYIPKRISYEV